MFANGIEICFIITGLTDTERQTELQDIHFMRIAVRLATADMYPFAAGLFGNAKTVIEQTECDFRELRFCDRAFVILTKWRRKLENRQEIPSAGRIVQIFEEMQENMETKKHVVCMVCWITVCIFYHNKHCVGKELRLFEKGFVWSRLSATFQ